jgi:hypothetical protein
MYERCIDGLLQAMYAIGVVLCKANTIIRVARSC